MNKLILYIVTLIFSFSCIGQNEKKPGKSIVWKNEKEFIHYEKDKKYKGPQDWYTDKPGSMQDESNNYNTNNSNSNTLQYNPQQIKRNREKRNAGYNRGGGKGDRNYDPEVERPQPIDYPEIDPPKIKPPHVDIDEPIIPATFWKVLGFILLFLAIIFGVYYFIKNKQPKDEKINLQTLENDWNPEVITKTELELLLEKYTAEENYRECVRIYFTFILKEIIKQGWIKWKKEKTNFDYILEMKNKPESFRFEESVRIYDLVWYGEYEISKEVFESIQPTLLSYYQFLLTVQKNG